MQEHVNSYIECALRK